MITVDKARAMSTSFQPLNAKSANKCRKKDQGFISREVPKTFLNLRSSLRTVWPLGVKSF
jgi:hypothetical protein